MKIHNLHILCSVLKSNNRHALIMNLKDAICTVVYRKLAHTKKYKMLPTADKVTKYQSTKLTALNAMIHLTTEEMLPFQTGGPQTPFLHEKLDSIEYNKICESNNNT